jgi:hypothetical protein
VRRSLAALTGVLVLAAAGCGGGGGSSGGSSSGASLPDAASVLPASAPIVITVNTDFSSNQWRKIAALFGKFPDGDQLVTQAQKELKGVQLSDFETALGPEVDITFLDLENGGDDVVALTQPKDRAKLKALLAKSSEPPVTEDVGDWLVVADKQKRLDEFDAARKQGTLDGSDAFRNAMKEAASDAAMTVYVNGPAVQSAVEKALARRGTKTSLDVGTLDWFVASARAEDDGVSISGDAHGSLKNPPDNFHPGLPDELPSGALVYVSFAHLDKPLGQLYKTAENASPSFRTQLGQAEGVLGLSVENDILPIFSGEGALAIYPSTEKTKGLSIPGIVLVEKVSDEAKVRTLLARLASIAALSGGSLKATSTTIAGIPAQRFEYEGVSVYAAVFDGKLVVTNAESVVSSMRGSGAKLADDPLYKQAENAAALPGDVISLFYVNLRDGLPTAFGLVQETGRTVPKAARDNTAPLRSVLLYSTADGHDYRLGGFLTIK